MMKTFRFATALALSLLASSAVAQWQTPNHSVPIGRGGGVVGFGSVAPSATPGMPFVSAGSGADPVPGPVVNAGITSGAADTTKGSLNGTTVTDIAWPSCTGLGQAIRWALGVGPSCGTVVAVTGFDMPINLGLTASSNGTALTFGVTQANGSAPTAGNPVVVPFRSTTATSGAVSLGTISSALSLTIPGSATLGTTNSTPFRIWIFLVANGGTPALGVATCSTATTILPCAAWESTLKTSVTIGAGSTSAGVLYAAAGVSNDAVRIVGHCDFSGGLVTVGTWASSCTTLQVDGPGSNKPGSVVQTSYTTSTAASSTTSATLATLSVVVTVPLTRTSNANLVRVHLEGTSSINGNGLGGLQLVAGSTLIGVLLNVAATTAYDIPFSLIALDPPRVTPATTYGFQGQIAGGNTIAAPPGSSGVVLVADEIMGALPEPANDNIDPGIFSKVG